MARVKVAAEEEAALEKAETKPKKEMRAERIARLFGNQTFEYVEAVELGPEGRCVGGARLIHGHKVRNTETGEEHIVGRGFMRKYAGIDMPRKPRGQPQEDQDQDLSFLDE